MRLIPLSLLTCSVALLSGGVRADSPVSEVELSKKLHFYSDIAELESSFRQLKKLKDLGMELKSEGRLKLIPPDAVVWQVTKPSPVRVQLDASQIEIRSGQGPSAQVTKLKRSDLAAGQEQSSLQGLVAWLQLDAHALYEQYEITSRDDRRFVFVPKKKGPFTALEMALAKDGHLESLVLKESSGDEMDLSFDIPRVKRKKRKP